MARVRALPVTDAQCISCEMGGINGRRCMNAVLARMGHAVRMQLQAIAQTASAD